MQTPSQNRRARLGVEPLEDRRLLAAGILDSTFNPGAAAPLAPGLQTFAFGPVSMERANAVAVQPDGKILAAGVFSGDLVGSSTGAAHQFGVARFNADGSPDTTFGSGGRTTVGFGGLSAEARALALQADGKIVLAGSVSFGLGNDDFALARLNADGSLDTTFDADGIKVLAVDGFLGVPRNDRLNAVAVQADGKIVAAGSVEMEVGRDTDFAVARFNADGSLDTSFTGSFQPGVRLLAFNLGPEGYRADEAFGLTLQTFEELQGATPRLAQRIVVAGTAQTGNGSSAMAVARLRLDGALDTTFNGTGTTTITFTGADGAAAVAAQLDGKIVLAGTTLASPGDHDFAVARLNFDGTLDTRFDGDGRQTVKFNRAGGLTDVATAVAIDQGRVLVAGVSFDGNGNADAAVARLNSDGRPDAAFGTGGKRAVGFDLGGSGGNTDGASAVAAHDGKVILAGFARNAQGNDDFAVARLASEGRPMTPGVYDTVTAMWYLRDTATAGAPTVLPFAYGVPGWTPLVGDWDGDGVFTVGIFDPTSATFYLRNSNTPGAPDAGVFAFGMAGWIPVAGDWDGDGKWSVGIFDPHSATWYLRNSTTPGAPDAGTFRYGGLNCKPVVGDWDGDGKWTIGIFDGGGRWYLRNSNSAGAPDVAPFAYGAATNRPTVGDWDGDGATTVGVYNAQGQWQLRNSNSAGSPDVAAFAYGGDGRFKSVAGVWVAPPLTLHAAGGEHVAGPAGLPVSQDVIAAAYAGALERLRQEGALQSQLDLLGRASVEVTNLPAGTLSRYDLAQNRLVVDDNGAGYGWYFDVTPLEDEEFLSEGVALPEGPAAGRMDLLSALLRQMRRVLDRLEGEAGVRPADQFAAGVRRLG
jgi:uncharacterized delta-60 repeat protein